MNKDIEKYEKEKLRKLKKTNPEEYEKILDKDFENRIKNKLWKDTRVGLFIFMGIHFFIEVFFSEGVGTGQPNPGVPVMVNFFISRYFIKNSIYKKNRNINKPLMYGIGISFIVFCFRVFLGGLLTLTYNL